MSAVTATEFAKAFGRYKEEAQREPIAITSHGRVSGYFISAREFEELQRLRAFERELRSGLDGGVLHSVCVTGGRRGDRSSSTRHHDDAREETVLVELFDGAFDLALKGCVAQVFRQGILRRGRRLNVEFRNLSRPRSLMSG